MKRNQNYLYARFLVCKLRPDTTHDLKQLGLRELLRQTYADKAAEFCTELGEIRLVNSRKKLF